MTISLPINIFIVCVRHNYNQRNNEVIYQKTYRYGNGGLEGRGEDDEDTINMCPEILVEPLSNCSKLTYVVRHDSMHGNNFVSRLLYFSHQNLWVYLWIG